MLNLNKGLSLCVLRNLGANSVFTNEFVASAFYRCRSSLFPVVCAASKSSGHKLNLGHLRYGRLTSIDNDAKLTTDSDANLTFCTGVFFHLSVFFYRNPEAFSPDSGIMS